MRSLDILNVPHEITTDSEGRPGVLEDSDAFLGIELETGKHNSRYFSPANEASKRVLGSGDPVLYSTKQDVLVFKFLEPAALIAANGLAHLIKK